MSKGRITLKEKSNKIVYDVTLVKFDVADTVYGFPGGGATNYEESLEMRQALQTLKGTTTAFTQRSKTYHNISSDNIRDFLQYNTGSTQEASIDYLQSLWLHNANPETLFVDFSY